MFSECLSSLVLMSSSLGVGLLIIVVLQIKIAQIRSTVVKFCNYELIILELFSIDHFQTSEYGREQTEQLLQGRTVETCGKLPRYLEI